MDVFVEPTSGCPQGHACCSTCYESVLASEQKKCPTCRHPTSTANLVRLRPLEDLLNKTLVKCKHADAGEDGAARNGDQGPVNTQPPRACKRAKISASAAGPAELQEEGGAGVGAAVEGGAGGGCTWTGRLGEVEAHLKASCNFELVPCPFSAALSNAHFNSVFLLEDECCTQIVLRRELEKHAAECDYRPVDCPHCESKVCFNELEFHEDQCDERAVECENEGCSVMVAQGDMHDHGQDDCEFETIACPCNGCEATVLRRDLQAHLAEFVGTHMLGLIKQNGELVHQQKQTELRMKQQVGMVAFQWGIARGWEGVRGSDVRSKQVRCGQFNICMVFSKLEQLSRNGVERFSFAVEVDKNVTLNAAAEIRVVYAAGVQVPWKQDRPVLVPSNQRPPGPPSDGHFAKFCPTAENKAQATEEDGAILVDVRLWLFSVERPGARLQQVSDA